MPDGIAHLFLVEIRSCRVEHPIARFDSIAYGTFSFLFRNLIDAESDGRHHHAIVQSYIFHISGILISDAKLQRTRRSVIT